MIKYIVEQWNEYVLRIIEIVSAALTSENVLQTRTLKYFEHLTMYIYVYIFYFFYFYE